MLEISSRQLPVSNQKKKNLGDQNFRRSLPLWRLDISTIFQKRAGEKKKAFYREKM